MKETQAQIEKRHARVLAFMNDINAQLDAMAKDGLVPSEEHVSFGSLMTYLYDQANELKDALKEVLFRGSPDVRDVINIAAASAAFAYLIAEKMRPSVTPTQD